MPLPRFLARLIDHVRRPETPPPTTGGGKAAYLRAMVAEYNLAHPERPIDIIEPGQGSTLLPWSGSMTVQTNLARKFSFGDDGVR